MPMISRSSLFRRRHAFITFIFISFSPDITITSLRRHFFRSPLILRLAVRCYIDCHCHFDDAADATFSLSPFRWCRHDSRHMPFRRDYAIATMPPRHTLIFDAAFRAAIDWCRHYWWAAIFRRQSFDDIYWFLSSFAFFLRRYWLIDAYLLLPTLRRFDTDAATPDSWVASWLSLRTPDITPLRH